MKEWNLLKKRRTNSMDNNYLWEKLKEHAGHRIEIVTYTGCGTLYFMRKR